MQRIAAATCKSSGLRRVSSQHAVTIQSASSQHPDIIVPTPIKKVNHHPLLLHPCLQTLEHPPCDVFINHRSIDTKKTFAGLLYQYLRFQSLNPFLDSKNMKPGDRLFDQINTAIRGCKLGVAVFSPRYCDSIYCLHELALLMEMKKRVIPIFCDVRPSELQDMVATIGNSCSSEDMKRYRWALEETRNTVGLTINSSKEYVLLIRSATFRS